MVCLNISNTAVSKEQTICLYANGFVEYLENCSFERTDYMYVC